MDLTTALLRAGLVPVTLPWLLVPTQRETGTLHTDKTVERGGGGGGGGLRYRVVKPQTSAKSMLQECN